MLFDSQTNEVCARSRKMRLCSANTNNKRLALLVFFVVTRTRIVKASLDGLLRKHPIIYPFRLRLWRTAERWIIEFDSLPKTQIKSKEKKHLLIASALW